MAIGVKAPDIYANPRVVTDPAQCFFYHTIDLPGIGTVQGPWDLRAGLADCLGHIGLRGKRVLDVGAANGALSFFMEDQGAEVISFDLDKTGDWDLVPFARWAERGGIAEDRRRIADRLNNAYWFCHRLRNSRARVVYGNVYRIPEDVGPVDVAVYGSILLHLRDPFLALQSGLRLTREAVVVTEHLRGDVGEGPVMGFLPDAATQEPKDTWWGLRPELIVRMIGVLGFEDVTVTYHQQPYEGRPNAMFTVVGRRQAAMSVREDTIDSRRLIENIRAHLRPGLDRLSAAGPLAPAAGGPGPALPSPQSERRAQDLAILRSRVDAQAHPLPSHRKVVGRVVRAVKKVVRQLMTPALEWQSAYNAAAIRLLESLDHEARILRSELDQRVVLHAELRPRLADLDQRTTALSADVDRRLVEADRRLAEADRLEGDVDHRLAAIEAFHGELRRQVPALARQHDDLMAEIAAGREQMGRAERKLRRLLESGPAGEKARPDDGLERSGPVTTQLSHVSFDYFAFEERYRGSEAEIKRQQRRYLRHFDGHAPVLDLGCGRGEFLELLMEAGVAARGVDVDLDMVLLCREKGLDVVQTDAFQHLQTVANGSLGGVFTSQFIEHLAPGAAIRLVDLVYQKLRPGGLFVVETINPQCLTVFARSFFLDPSHVWPFHPATLSFVLETRGFTRIETEYFNPVAPPAAPAAGAETGGPRGLELINELLLGPQDYAISGRKPLADTPATT